MRKINSKKEEARREKRNRMVLVGIFIVILLGSTFGIVVDSFNNSDETQSNVITYEGIDFVYQNGFWVMERYGGTFAFLNTPYDTQGLAEENTLSRSIQSYSGVPVYVYSEDSGAEIEIYRNLYPLAERMQNACPEGIECSDTYLPVKSCSDNLIIIQESEENKIIQDENCVYIYGQKENLIKLSDEFLFSVMEVI